MAEYRVNQVPLDVLRRLLVLDRWNASRTWPGGFRSGSGTVNPVESLVIALATNASLNLPIPQIFALADGHEPTDLVGAGDDKDVLRDGIPLAVTIDSGDDGLQVVLPGLLGALLQQERYTHDIPRFEGSYFFFTVSVGASDIRLRPAQRDGDVRLSWNTAGPVLVVTVDFETEDQEIVGTFGVDWDTVRVTLHCRPRLVEERLRWDFRLRVQLEPEVTFGPAGIAQYEVTKGIYDVLRPLVARWGTLAMNVLLLLPLRPMRDGQKFFNTLATTDAVQLGLWVAEQFYASDVPDSWLDELIHSALVPHNPLRCLALNAGALSEGPIDFFYARLADLYVRHRAQPAGTADDDSGPAVVFDVVPIDADGTQRALTDPLYGRWSIPSYDASPSDGEHCVVREQFEIQLAHLTLSQRSFSGSGGGPWRVRGQIQVRHANLAARRWARMQSFDFTTVSVHHVLPGTADSRWFEWLEVRGEVRVVGTIEDGSGQVIGWFDQSGKVGALPSASNGQTTGGGAIALADHAPEDPQPQPGERRAGALIRLVQLTSLRRYMLDWLALTLNELQLDSAARKIVLDGVYAAPVMDAGMLRIRVNGDQIALVQLTAQQLGTLQAGQPVRFPGALSRYDLYFAPGQETLTLHVELGVLGASGGFEALLSATRAVNRTDPALPGLEWQIPPGMPGRQLSVANASGGFRTRLYLQNAFFDAGDVALEHVPKPYQIGLTKIDVVEPTEFWIFNWRVMRFTARFWAELDGEQVGPASTLQLGPFTQATPVLLPFRDKTKVMENSDFRREVQVPAGGRIRVEVSGREVGEGPIPVATTDLGTAVETFTIAMDVDPAEGSDAVEAQSTTTGFFRFFSAIRVASRPPTPVFSPDDALPTERGVDLAVASGTLLTYRYGTVPWTTILQLQWCAGHESTDDEVWELADTPAITHEGNASVLIDATAGTRRRFRVRARNARGSRYSRVLFLSVT